jgi:hypothetical protein
LARRTYIFAGPPGSADDLMTIIETALGLAFVRVPGSDPYIRADPVVVYVSGHDFDDGDIDTADGRPVPLRTAYPSLVDIRDTERDQDRQQDTAARIFPAVKADGRVSAVLVDDMQHVVDPANRTRAKRQAAISGLPAKGLRRSDAQAPPPSRTFAAHSSGERDEQPCLSRPDSHGLLPERRTRSACVPEPFPSCGSDPQTNPVRCPGPTAPRCGRRQWRDHSDATK